MVLAIAGFDPYSGAGATADLKTIAAHGCYGVACLTALTVQSTRGVKRVEPVDAQVIRETLRELAADVSLGAIKIGMLATAPVVNAVADFLERIPSTPVVLDPILRSTSGARLLDSRGKKLLIERLLPLATVLTPNVDEASALSGLAVRSVRQMKAAARRLHQLHARNVVVTGGHLRQPVEVLSMPTRGGIRQVEFPGQKIRSTSTHGTGCAFSSSIASNLGMGKSLGESVKLAKAYVTQAIRTAYPVGMGRGPLNHFPHIEFTSFAE